MQWSLDKEESTAEGQNAAEVHKVEVAAGARGYFAGLVCREIPGEG